MFLTNEEIEKRLNSEDNLINIKNNDKIGNVKVIKHAGVAGGRTAGHLNTTEEERIAAGVLSRTVGSQIAAEIVGISPMYASQIGGGSKGNVIDKVDSILDSTKKQVETLAAERLLTALGFLDDDKLANSKATDLASIAANMSRTMSNMRDKVVNNSSGGVKVNVILYQPKQAKEDHFDFIEVSA